MSKLNIAFLASHGGSNMQAILDAINRGDLDATPVVVISNNSKSKAFDRAENENVPRYHLSGQTHPNPEELDLVMCDTLEKYQTDLVILAGYMKKIGDRTLSVFNGRILNIHPALLPKFGGQGMFGMRVHEAVLDSGETESGVTIHVIDDQYDNGPIIAQEKVPVLKDDSADTLAERVLKVEHKLYSETIGKIANGEIKLPSL